MQDAIVPLVRFTSERPGSATVLDALGTAFFVDESGILLTLASLLRDAGRDASLGLVVRIRDGRTPHAVVPIVEFENAETPWDVAIGRADVASRRAFSLAHVEAQPLLGRELGTLGCVALDRSKDARSPLPVFRAHSGCVLRESSASPGRAPAIDLAFAVPSLLRGAPVFVHERPIAKLVAICAGNGSLGELRYPGVFGEPDATRRDTHGVAFDLRGLGPWRPKLLAGRSLREIC